MDRKGSEKSTNLKLANVSFEFLKMNMTMVSVDKDSRFAECQICGKVAKIQCVESSLLFCSENHLDCDWFGIRNLILAETVILRDSAVASDVSTAVSLGSTAALLVRASWELDSLQYA